MRGGRGGQVTQVLEHGALDASERPLGFFLGFWGRRTFMSAGGRGAMCAEGAAGRCPRFSSTVRLMRSSASRLFAFFMLLTLMRRRCVSM